MGIAAPPPVPAPPASRSGRALVVAGTVLLTCSLVVGTLGSALTLGRVDPGRFDRDVVVDGPRTAAVPGRIRFRVDEPLDAGTDREMTVGVGVDGPAAPRPRCTITTVEGAGVGAAAPLIEDRLRDDPGARMTVVAVARLAPGSYLARCTHRGEPSAAPRTRFTVGRVLGPEDLGGVLGPALGFLAVAGVAGLCFLTGAVLLVVGLVRSGRRRRPSGG